MPEFTIAAGAADSVIQGNALYSEVFIQNPTGSLKSVTFHQGGHGAGPDTKAPILAAGNNVTLNLSRPVYLNTDDNTGGVVRITFLA